MGDEVSAKLWPCFVCEKRYAELEQAEKCEQKHAEKAAKGTK